MLGIPSSSHNSNLLSGLVSKPARHSYCVFNLTEQSFLGTNVMRADTAFSRLRGLLGKLKLKSGDGLWMVPSMGVHTIGLMFPIDLIYLDDENRVVHCEEHLMPFRISPIRMKSASVLELPLHTIYASQTRVGNQILICRPHEMEAYLKLPAAMGQSSPGRKED
jgi:uncharacterized membrane protein (UPF0127 family)